MTLTVKDRVKELTTTTGTGTLTLVSAPSGFRRFSSVLSDGDTTYYCIESGAQWEVGTGTYSSNTLARTTVLASSNSNNLINITAARSFVFISYVADKAVYKDVSGRIVSGAAGIIFSDNTVQTTAPVAVDLSPYLTSATAASTYVALAGSYSNPSWITSLAWGKISSTPTTLAGYGITDGALAASYVPYTGATGAVNLGAYGLTCGAITASGAVKSQASQGSNGLVHNTNSYDVFSTVYDGAVMWLKELQGFVPLGLSSGGSKDILLSPGSHKVTQRNGTNVQCFQLHETYTSDTNRGWLDFKATGSAYEISSAKGSAGGSNRPINIGHRDSAGTFTNVVTVGTDGYLKCVTGEILAGYDDSGFYFGGGLGITTKDIYLGGASGRTILVNKQLMFGGGSALFPALIRSGTTLGLRLADNSADAALTCGAITASGGVNVTGGGLSGTDGWKGGSYGGGFGGIWPASVTPGVSNYSFLFHANSLSLNSGGGTLVLETAAVGRWQVRYDGTFGGATDNTYDIGEAAARRPRNVYVGGTITAGGQITQTPPASVTLATNGQFSIEMTSDTAGNLVYRGSDGTTRRCAIAFV